jgi:hypothetical protein
MSAASQRCGDRARYAPGHHRAQQQGSHGQTEQHQGRAVGFVRGVFHRLVHQLVFELLQADHGADVALHRRQQAGLQHLGRLRTGRHLGRRSGRCCSGRIGRGRRRLGFRLERFEVSLTRGDVFLAAFANVFEQGLALLALNLDFQGFLQLVDALGGLGDQRLEVGIHLGVVARLGQCHDAVDVEPGVRDPLIGQGGTALQGHRTGHGGLGAVQAAQGDAREHHQQQEHAAKTESQALGNFELTEVHTGSPGSVG